MALTLVCFEWVVFFAVFSFLLAPNELLDGSVAVRLQAHTWPFLLSASCIGALRYADLYDRHIVHRVSAWFMGACRAVALVLVPLGLFGIVLLPYDSLSWPRVAAAIFIGGVIVLLDRVIWHRLLMHDRSFAEQVVVLGKTPLARAVIAELQARPDYQVLDEGFIRPVKDGLPLVGPHDKQFSEPHPHRIVIAMGERRGRVPMEALLDAKRRGIFIEDGVELYERLTGKVAIETLQPSHVVFTSQFSATTFYDYAARSISCLAAAIGLCLSAPLLACIAILVKADSSGPVLFVQDRIGRDGRRFPLWKFRTMRPSDDRRSEWVQDNGHRITRVGYWLRKFRLDELPQLFNVLMGHMNLVGPRPHPASNYQLFIDRIPFYAFRSLVRPGITGWAQVRYGYANNLQEETEKMRYDLYYIKHRSLLLDWEIVIRTVKVVLLGSDARLDGTDMQTEPLVKERSDAA
jgi:exopolysaccharide biosynthesis polyprenyl glycosylphosphotransferase